MFIRDTMVPYVLLHPNLLLKIGRASCRERVYVLV